MFVGIDIGYSNTKVCYGTSIKDLKEYVMPSGTGPVELAPRRPQGGIDTCGGHIVQVEGRDYLAGVPVELLSGGFRRLSENYPQTDEYLALFYSVLRHIDVKQVDVLMTGLPTSQHIEDVRRARLRQRLEGRHAISTDRTVTVGKVGIVAQPMGAMQLMTFERAGARAGRGASSLSIDIGFFSTDWVLVNHNGSVNTSSSHSTVEAMSRVLEIAASAISSACAPSRTTRERLEQAIRSGSDTVLLGDKEVAYEEFVQFAADRVVEKIFATLDERLRVADGVVNEIVLTGGGARFIREAVRRKFPGCAHWIPERPVTANARGFALLAFAAAGNMSGGEAAAKVAVTA